MPMANEIPGLISNWLDGVRPEHRDLLLELNRLIVSVEPKLTISLKWRNPAYSRGVETFLYLADQKDYVHLGFYNGASLDDPHKLIEGTGKNLRHIKVSTLDPETEQILRETITACLAAGSNY
jgi:hypothetical protein